MTEIAGRSGFVPRGDVALAILARRMPASPSCAARSRAWPTNKLGPIQNVGVTPAHRGQGSGHRSCCGIRWLAFSRPASSGSFLKSPPKTAGPAAFIERLGFKQTKVVYKASEVAYAELVAVVKVIAMACHFALHSPCSRSVPQKIYSHQLPNGLTLVAEEMHWLESAAFALLVPAGCAYEPADKLGLGNLTCEMAQRGAGERDSRQFLADLENLGADTSASVSIAHTSFGGAMPAESLPQVLAIYADLIQRPHLPEDQLEDARLGCLQEVRAIEDDLAQKTMQQLAPAALCRALGPQLARHRGDGHQPDDGRRAAALSSSSTRRTERSSASPARSTGPS